MTEANQPAEAREPTDSTEALESTEPRLDDVIEPEFDIPPTHRPRMHGGMPLRPDDDELAAAVERDRVAAGIEDYAPSDVPPAMDPLPEGSSEAADLAQRGLLGDTTAPS
jgi:hypothetical protein